MSARRRRQRNVPGGRPHRYEVRVSDAEREALVAVAAQQDVSVPRLLVEAALAGERLTATVRTDLIAELLDAKRVLATVANNVNQVARHANTVHELPDGLPATLEEVQATVGRLDAAVRAVAGR